MFFRRPLSTGMRVENMDDRIDKRTRAQYRTQVEEEGVVVEVMVFSRVG